MWIGLQEGVDMNELRNLQIAWKISHWINIQASEQKGVLEQVINYMFEEEQTDETEEAQPDESG